MNPIETTRLLIRNFRSGDDLDVRDLLELVVQKEASPYAAYDHPWPTSEEEIRGVAAWFASEDRFLAVCLKESGKVIGYICLNLSSEVGPEGLPVELDRVVLDLGYCFNEDFHRQGYATEGCTAVIDYAFSTLHAAQITAGTGAPNEPSCRLLFRLGMRKTGEAPVSFRQTPEGEPLVFTGWSFALTKEEWEKRRK